MTTEDQFRKFIQRPDRIQDIVNYIICVLVILGGLFLLLITFQIFAIRPKNDLDIFVGTLLLVIGFYGIWRIPNSYNITKINSNITLEQKRQLIENYIKTVEVRQRFVTGNLFRIVYDNKFWNRIILSIGYDQNQILINAHSKGGAIGSGFIDFGLTKRAANKAKDYFNEKASL